MTWALFSFVFIVAALLALLLWSLRSSRAPLPSANLILPGLAAALEHAGHFPQVRQCLSPDDLAFLSRRGSRGLARRARADRRRVTLEYLDALHKDFRELLQLARVLAVLSPQVTAQQEGERFSLAVRFEFRYQMTRAIVLTGGVPLSQLRTMTEMVGTFGARLEAAMARLGNEAGIAA